MDGCERGVLWLGCNCDCERGTEICVKNREIVIDVSRYVEM